MAIKVGGTSVIDDSLNLQNIASIDATTEAAFTAAGFSQTTGDITAVTAGSGLTGGGTGGDVTISHSDTSSQGSVNNSGSTVIQDITLDTYGHITNINSTTISTSPPSSVGAVGTYAFLGNSGTTTVTQGTTVTGWKYAGVTPAYSDGTSGKVVTGTTASGTWRAMGNCSSTISGGNKGTIFIRIS